MDGVATVLALGLLLGLQHATDADHVIAVSTIVARTRRLRAAARIGVLWGVGHAATVFLAGGAMVATGFVLPARAAQALEMFVAAMLVLLGVMGVRRARAALGAIRRGADAPAPADAHGHAHDVGLRPVVVGVVHGLAGSAALALAVLATVRDRVVAGAYLLLFAIGTLVGMAVVTALLAAPMSLAAKRVRPVWLHRAALAAGLLSIGFGAWLGYHLGFEEGLFLGQASAALP